MKGHWVVLLEAIGDDRSTLGDEGLARLAAAIEDCRPRLLHITGRYALQVEVTAHTALEAHSAAVARWRKALAAVGAPEWSVVRVEVLTAHEFEQDCRASEWEDGLGHSPDAPERPDSPADQLLRDVFEDPVTHLPTGELFRAQVEQILSRPHPHGTHHAVLMVRYSVSTPVAALLTEGHDDLVLLEVVKRLIAITRRGDTVANLGPGTLGLLVAGIGKKDAMTLGERAVAAVSRPVRGPAGHMRLAGSVGIALSHAGHDDVDGLLAAAAAAMDGTTKDRGRRWERFGTGVPWPGSTGPYVDASGAEGAAEEG